MVLNNDSIVLNKYSKIQIKVTLELHIIYTRIYINKPHPRIQKWVYRVIAPVLQLNPSCKSTIQTQNSLGRLILYNKYIVRHAIVHTIVMIVLCITGYVGSRAQSTGTNYVYVGSRKALQRIWKSVWQINIFAHNSVRWGECLKCLDGVASQRNDSPNYLVQTPENNSIGKSCPNGARPPNVPEIREICLM